MSSPKINKPTLWLIRPRDQASTAAVLAAALALMATLWWRSGGAGDGLVDIDRAAPLSARFQVDVNHAEWPELIQLPGVGPTLAERIVTDRASNGEFHRLDDLARVRGLGPRTLDRIRPYLLPLPDDSNMAVR